MVGFFYLGLTRLDTPKSTPTTAEKIHTTAVESTQQVEEIHTTATQQVICRLKTGYANGTVNLRSGSGIEYSIITILSEGDVLEYLGQSENGFKQVKMSDKNVIGWVREIYVSCTE